VLIFNSLALAELLQNQHLQRDLQAGGSSRETAFHQFAEVSIAIGVALVLTLIWPEREDAPLAKKVSDSPRKTNGDQGKLNEFRHRSQRLPPLQTRDLERVALRRRERIS
jgi:hypothetical protein